MVQLRRPHAGPAVVPDVAIVPVAPDVAIVPVAPVAPDVGAIVEQACELANTANDEDKWRIAISDRKVKEHLFFQVVRTDLSSRQQQHADARRDRCIAVLHMRLRRRAGDAGVFGPGERIVRLDLEKLVLQNGLDKVLLHLVTWLHESHASIELMSPYTGERGFSQLQQARRRTRITMEDTFMAVMSVCSFDEGGNPWCYLDPGEFIVKALDGSATAEVDLVALDNLICCGCLFASETEFGHSVGGCVHIGKNNA